MILVMPFGSTGSFTDKEWANGVGRHDAWETFMARDVVRSVDARYRTIRAGRARAIGGLSEGGYGALNIALHHPGEFRVVESWSGYERADDIGSIFGHQPTLLRMNSPQLTVAAAAARLRAAHTMFWFYTGTDDRAVTENPGFEHARPSAPAPPFFLVRGGHNWALQAAARPVRTWRHREASLGRKAAALPLVLFVTTAATGWMYLLHPWLPGPRLRTGTPAGRPHTTHPFRSSGTSSFGRPQPRCSVSTHAGRGSSGRPRYSCSAFPSRFGATSPSGCRWPSFARCHCGVRSIRLPTSTVLVAPAAVAIGVALRPTSARRRPRPFRRRDDVALGGLLNLLHAILPGDDPGILRSRRTQRARSHTPPACWRRSHCPSPHAAWRVDAAAPGNSRRRCRRLDDAARALRFNHGTVASTVVLVLLVARRHDFDRPGDVAGRRLVAVRFVTALGAIALYALVAIWLNRMAADQPFSFAFAFRETLDGLTAAHVNGSPHFVGGFGDWFPLSLILLGAGAVLWTLSTWIAPWRHRVVQQERERALARALVHAWGADTLAPFVLRSDKAYFFSAAFAG
jgi:esterase/lipase superfamily enzyme